MGANTAERVAASEVHIRQLADELTLVLGFVPNPVEIDNRVFQVRFRDVYTCPSYFPPSVWRRLSSRSSEEMTKAGSIEKVLKQ